MLSSVVLEPTLGGANALQLYARFLTTDKALIDSKFLDEAIPPGNRNYNHWLKLHLPSSHGPLPLDWLLTTMKHAILYSLVYLIVNLSEKLEAFSKKSFSVLFLYCLVCITQLIRVATQRRDQYSKFVASGGEKITTLSTWNQTVNISTAK